MNDIQAHDKACKDYVLDGGTSCLYCGSDNLEIRDHSHGIGYINVETQCIECERQWTEHYVLSSTITEENKAENDALLYEAMKQND